MPSMELSPPIVVSPVRRETVSPVTRRMVALLVLLGSGGVLGLAAWLTPVGEGLGTHEQIGMPPCGWIMLMDMPCPTCGMTTSFSHAADGDFVSSFVAQPLGMVLAIATAMAFLVSLWTLLSGQHVERMLRRLWFRRAGWWLVAIVLVAWGYKILSYRGIL